MTNLKAVGHIEDRSTHLTTEPILTHNLHVQIFWHICDISIFPLRATACSLNGQMLPWFGWSLADHSNNQQDTVPELPLAGKMVLNSLFYAIPKTTQAISMNAVNVTQKTMMPLKHPVTVLFMYFSPNFLLLDLADFPS